MEGGIFGQDTAHWNLLAGPWFCYNFAVIIDHNRSGRPSSGWLDKYSWPISIYLPAYRVCTASCISWSAQVLVQHIHIKVNTGFWCTTYPTMKEWSCTMVLSILQNGVWSRPIPFSQHGSKDLRYSSELCPMLPNFLACQASWMTRRKRRQTCFFCCGAHCMNDTGQTAGDKEFRRRISGGYHDHTNMFRNCNQMWVPKTVTQGTSLTGEQGHVGHLLLHTHVTRWWQRSRMPESLLLVKLQYIQKSRWRHLITLMCQSRYLAVKN